MEITYTKTVKSPNYWSSKGYGAIFVKSEANIKPVYEILVDQDYHWERENGINNLIKVIPENPSPEKLMELCDYTGKQDIYDMDDFLDKLAAINVEVFICWHNV